MAAPDLYALPALVVSLCSAAVTLSGLAWQLWLYRLQGARLKVQLVFSYRTDFGLTMAYHGRLKKLSWERWHRENNAGLGIEYAQVRVTNVGRTAVSVENVSLDLGRDRWWRRGRRTVIPKEFVDPSSDTTKRPNPPPYRLEPGANVTQSYMVWPGLGNPEPFKHRRFRRLVVRGSAQAVGRRATRSRRRLAWHFRRRDMSAFSDVTVVPSKVRVYRALWHHQDWVDGISPVFRHREVLQALKEGKTEDELRDFLDSRNIDPKTGEPRKFQTHHIVAHEAHYAFHHVSHLSAWGEINSPAD